jgi:hypothetical protein
MGLDTEYQGEKIKVVHCEGAIESFEVALQKVPNKSRKDSMKRSVIALIERLAGGHRMSKVNFPKEGELPKRAGQSNGHFFAFKKIPVRGYVWLSKRLPSTYFISHYIYKKRDELQQADTERVGKNWSRIEEGGDER